MQGLRARSPESRSASRPVATASAATVDLLGERVDGIAAAQARALDGPIGQDDRERHGQVTFAAQIGEFESEGRAIEVELEAVRERPARLAQCSGNARDGQVGLS